MRNTHIPTPGAAASTAAGLSEASQRSVPSILQALRGLRFGSVEIIVQDGRIVQIDRLEKRRLV